MSKDRLEEFIQENREDFDTEIPGLNLWSEIDDKINPKKKATKTQIAGRAAAMVVVLIMVCCWFFIPSTDHSQIANLNQSPNQLLEEANPELAEMSEYYTRKINKNKGRLAAMNHHDPDLYRDLKHMELMFDTLRMEWESNPHKSDEKLVNAMVANYKTRSMLLENVVGRIEGGKNSVTSARPALFREW